MCVEGEHQRQVVRIPSADQFRYAAGDLLTAAKEISAPQYGLDPIKLLSDPTLKVIDRRPAIAGHSERDECPAFHAGS